MKHKKMSIKAILNLIGRLFFIIGLVLFIAGCYWLYSDINFKKTANSTEAVITDIEVYRKHGDLKHKTIVDYIIDGVEYEQKLDEYSTGMRIGDKITIYYDPEHPDDIKTGSLIIPIIAMSIGGLYVIIGSVFFIINFRSSRRKKYLMENGDVLTGVIIDVKQNLSVRVNRRHPYKAECEYIDPYTNERYLYVSENIDDDISEFIGREVTIYVDKNDKSKYYVDINELLSGNINIDK